MHRTTNHSGVDAITSSQTWSFPKTKHDKYSLLMHCIKIKAPRFFLLNEQYVLMGGYISIQCMCHHVAPKRLSQLDYELNDLKISLASWLPLLVSTRWVNGTPTSEVTSVTIWQILTSDLGHQMVTVMIMNDLLPPPLFNVNRPSHSEITAIHGQGHVCGQRSRSHLRHWVQLICLLFRVAAIRPFLAEI